MNICVFLGPSLHVDEARELLPEATYLPPARAGDLVRAVQRGAQVIAIIDGFFEQVPSVWHKEVLHALSRGVHVYGASSMGALRAAELHSFGMVGVGRIFEAYRDGACEDDDEVTVVHGGAADGWRPLSEAMVNVRYGLAGALGTGCISQSTCDVVLAGLKRRHYPERTWALVPEIGRAERLPPGQVEALITYVKTEDTNLKRLDAIECLNRLVQLAAAPFEPFAAGFDFQASVFWTQLVNAVRLAPSAAATPAPTEAPVPIEAIRSHVAVVERDAESIFEGALFLYLAAKEAQRLGLQVTAGDAQRAAERFRRSHGLFSAAKTHLWLGENRAGSEQFSALMEMSALVEALLHRYASGVDAFLPAELLRRGRFASVWVAIQEKQALLDSLGLTHPSPEDAGTSANELVRFYEDHFRRLDAPLKEHRERRGLADAGRFMRELLAEFMRAERTSAAVAPGADASPRAGADPSGGGRD